MALQMVNIGYRQYARYFNLEQARELLPVVRHITNKTYIQLKPFRQQLQSMTVYERLAPEMESQYKKHVTAWIEKMTRLGMKAVTLGVVDFDTGDGYLCWKYPEVDLYFFHDYHDDYAQRVSIERVIARRSHDWAG